MAVNVQGDHDIAMSQQFLHHFRMNSFRPQQRGGVMPQVVKTHALQANTAQQPLKRREKCGGMEVAPVATCIPIGRLLLFNKIANVSLVKRKGAVR